MAQQAVGDDVVDPGVAGPVGASLAARQDTDDGQARRVRGVHGVGHVPLPFRPLAEFVEERGDRVRVPRRDHDHDLVLG